MLAGERSLGRRDRRWCRRRTSKRLVSAAIVARILQVCNTDFYLARFLSPLVRALGEAGHEVECVCERGRGRLGSALPPAPINPPRADMTALSRRPWTPRPVQPPMLRVHPIAPRLSNGDRTAQVCLGRLRISAALGQSAHPIALQRTQPGPAGHGPDQTDFNPEWRDNMAFFYRPPRCQVHRTSALAVTTSVTTYIPWQAEDFDQDDNGGMWAVSPNPTRIIFQTAGLYAVSAEVQWQLGTGERWLTMRDTGGAIIPGAHSVANGLIVTYQSMSIVREFAPSDYIEVGVLHNHGSNRNIEVVSGGSPFLTVHWLGGPVS